MMSQNGHTHFKNLAAFAARFLKCVWPFWDIMHQMVKSFFWQWYLKQFGPSNEWIALSNSKTFSTIANFYAVKLHSTRFNITTSQFSKVLIKTVPAEIFSSTVYLHHVVLTSFSNMCLSRKNKKVLFYYLHLYWTFLLTPRNWFQHWNHLVLFR